MLKDSHGSGTCTKLVVALLLFSFLTLLVSQTNALSCPPCDQNACINTPVKCAYGRVRDACGCCLLCGNGPNEPCGGEFMILGKCGKELECRSNNASGRLEFIEGICVQKKPRIRSYKSSTTWRKLPPGLKKVHRSTGPPLGGHQQQNTAIIPANKKKHPKQLLLP